MILVKISEIWKLCKKTLQISQNFTKNRICCILPSTAAINLHQDNVLGVIFSVKLKINDFHHGKQEFSENVRVRKVFPTKLFMILQFPPLCTKHCKYKGQINDFPTQITGIPAFPMNSAFPVKMQEFHGNHTFPRKLWFSRKRRMVVRRLHPGYKLCFKLKLFNCGRSFYPQMSKMPWNLVNLMEFL